MGEGMDGRTGWEVMTAIELIELAQEQIRNAYVTDYRFNNVQNIGQALKYLNESKILIN